MNQYGIKMNGGKLLWVVADVVECRDGAVLFLREKGGRQEIIAGFSLTQITHFGLPDAFQSTDPQPS